MRMDISIYLMVAGLVLFDAIIFTESQDCANYKTISDSRRSTKQEFILGDDTPISDKDIDPNKWYRFQSYVGNMIPERAEGESVELNHCGTTYPIYISGLNQHPTKDSETRTAIAKVNAWEAEISIHNCPSDVDNESSFFIYLLVPSSADQTAYCAGEGVPCPRGYMYNGFGCVDYFPRLTSGPIFSGPHTTGEYVDQQVYFTCQILYDRAENDTFARFLTTFIFDGFEIANIEAPHNTLLPSNVEPSDEPADMSVNLTEYHLQGRLGKTIQCKVRSYWDGNSEMSNPKISSASYKATIEAVDIFDFDVKNGTHQTIVFNPTLPFTYYHCSTDPLICPSPFGYFFNLNTTLAIDDPDCSILWTNGTVPKLEVYIKPFSGNRIFEIKFQPYDSVTESRQSSISLWQTFVIPTVTVRVFNSSAKVCYSTSDPHITTFDGLYFNNYFDGDFYLVREESNQLQVQVRQETCNNNVACNCGVIVREMNSVVKVSYNECGKWDWTTERPISATRLLAQYPYDGTEITRDDVGRKYSIRMPSGTRLEIDGTIPWFSIQVHLAPIYHGKTLPNSMCGDSNGFKENDYNESSIFSIKSNESYFDVQPNCSEDFFPPAMTCACLPSSYGVYCTNIEQNIAMKSSANSNISNIWSSNKTCVDPASTYPEHHSSVESDADYILDTADLFPPFVPDPNAGHNLNLTWPTPKGKTKEDVEEFCLDMLTASPVYSDCHTVSNTDIIKLQCVSDVQIADEYITTTFYTDSFGQDCVNVLIDKNSTEAGTPPGIDISTIYSKICPAQCSGHGTCTNATCICNTGYVGADCSIDEKDPPVLTGIVRSGICDIQQRPCATISVFGYGLILSKAMRCRFSAVGGGSVVDTVGTFVTGSEVSCSVPNITTERPATTIQGISVANDGILYSNVMDFLTFDSVCMSCGQDKVCTQKTDACLISDRCFASGAMKDLHTCKQCSPSQSTNSWTDKPVAETLQPCSRTCDYGAQYKQTVCTANNAVIKAEPLLCHDSICAAIPEENLQGVVLIISNEDTTKILLTPTNILYQVAEVVNSYCSAHATQCCNSVGVPNGITLSSLTSLELCSYGSGYPQVGETSSRVKVIVKMIPSQVQNECVQSAPQRSTEGEEAYAHPDIIVTAVTEGKDAIEKALGITIVSVEKGDGSNSGEGLPVAKHTLILATTVTAFAMIRLF